MGDHLHIEAKVDAGPILTCAECDAKFVLLNVRLDEDEFYGIHCYAYSHQATTIYCPYCGTEGSVPRVIDGRANTLVDERETYVTAMEGE
jgi:hypothetical protein